MHHAKSVHSDTQWWRHAQIYASFLCGMYVCVSSFVCACVCICVHMCACVCVVFVCPRVCTSIGVCVNIYQYPCGDASLRELGSSSQLTLRFHD